MALTHDEKLELLKSLPDELAGDEFYAPPAATRGREVIRWEDNLPLDVFRAWGRRFWPCSNTRTWTDRPGKRIPRQPTACGMRLSGG